MTNQSKKRKFLATTLTASMVAAAVAPVAGAAAADVKTFPDVPADHAYAKVISDMANAGIVKGEPNGNFNLGGKITRAEAAQMTAGLLNLKTGAEANATQFEDVKGDVWYTGAINSLVDKGVIAGVTEKTFEPGSNITRGQLAQLLVVAYGLEDVNVDKVELPFTDVAEGSWYEKPIKILYSEGLIKGQTATTFAPKADMKRGDFAWLAANIDYVHGNTLPKPEEVTKEHQIKVTPAASVVQANGADNTVIKFEILKPNGEVDTTANNMVLEVGTTFGKLANSRVTVQNGVAQIILQSEFSVKDVEAKVTAQLIEASSDEYKELIGKLTGEATVKFSPSSITTDPNAVTFQDAESNQADRVVLYFDKEVSPATFVKTNADGTFKTTVDKKEQILKDNVELIIEQGGKQKRVVGVVPVKGNTKAVEVLVAKEDYLTDNAKVDLDVKIGTTRNQRSFILTDARQPEFTGVQSVDLRTLNLEFSESYAEGNFSIDGILEGVTGKAAGVNEFQVIPGEFDAVKGVDNRHTATVKLGKVVKDGQVVQNYFKAGQHSITVNQLKDWAGLTDNANVSTSQTLNFTVAADEALPKAEVIVESPEQFRVKFNRDVTERLAQGETLNQLFNKAFQVYNKEAKEWQTLSSYSSVFKAEAGAGIPLDQLLTVEQVNETEYVVELRSDWTQLMVKANDVYYNYAFQFDFGKEKFENLTNGKLSEAFKLDLSTEGSALTTPDNKSPEIADIIQTLNPSIYEVHMNEPVKLNGQKGDKAGDTLATNQSSLPVVQAEFQGKNAKGEAVVIKADILGYSDLDGADKKFKIETKEIEQLQALVNAGYSENWTVVVRSISDDIGNTAATLTKDFVVAKETKETGFKIISPENDFKHDDVANGISKGEGVIAIDATKPGEKDQLIVTFTKGVNQAGIHNLTSTANWTLNGNNLSTLANVESIKVRDTNSNATDGYEQVIITFKDDRAFGAHSNVVSVNKNIESLDGTLLSGEYEVVAKTVDTNWELPEGPETPETDLFAETPTIVLETTDIGLNAISGSGTVKAGTDFDKVVVKTDKDQFTATVNGNKFELGRKVVAAIPETVTIEVYKGTELVGSEKVKVQDIATLPAVEASIVSETTAIGLSAISGQGKVRPGTKFDKVVVKTANDEFTATVTGNTFELSRKVVAVVPETVTVEVHNGTDLVESLEVTVKAK